MPWFKHIQVSVTVEKNGPPSAPRSEKKPNRQRQALEEWGIQNLRGKNKVSTYIEAQTDKTFQISITPRIPFPPGDLPTAHDYDTRWRKADRDVDPRPGFFKMEDEWEDFDGNRYRKSRSASGPSYSRSHSEDVADARTKAKYEEMHGVKIKEEPKDDENPFADYKRSLTPPRAKPTSNRHASSASRPRDRVMSASNQHPPPPFHLLAILYLDGRKKAERKAIIYLDPDDEDFVKPNGEVILKYRWVQLENGTMKEQAWVFKDVGIETLFDQMLIKGDVDTSTPVHVRDENALIDAMNATAMEAKDTEKEEKTEIGKIVVELHRVKLGEDL
jgi:hypothetical protein